MQLIKYAIFIAALTLNGWITQGAYAQSPLRTVAVSSTSDSKELGLSVDAVVEAVRQTTLSSQVSASVVALQVQSGDRVRGGQILARLDNSTAQNDILLSASQLQAAKSNLNAVAKDLERKKQLLAKEYVSQSAFDRAEVQYDTAYAQVKALEAQNSSALNNSSFYTLKAPYDAVVSEVNVALGDLAMPGRALITLYDPKSLRLKAFVAQSIQAKLGNQAHLEYEIPGVPKLETPQKVPSYQWIPNVDAFTHSIEMRIPLPSASKDLLPGTFARVIFHGLESEQERLWLPRNAVIYRSELVAVYVINNNKQAQLRQVKLGEIRGNWVEILSGLSMGEMVSLDPQVAAKAH